ncbi:hypothetical protein Tco_1023766 [Tanacetum coccineum]
MGSRIPEAEPLILMYCNQFKVRGVKVKEELEKAVAGITVVINPEKPRRGCFEIHEEGGKTFISLLIRYSLFAILEEQVKQHNKIREAAASEGKGPKDDDDES